MKKILITLFLAVLILPLSACSSKNEETNIFEADSTLYVKKTGKIIANEELDAEQKFLLEISAKEKYYLESIFVDLANSKYQQGQVEVIGLLHKSLNEGYDLIQAEKVTPLSSAADTANLNEGQTQEYSSFKMGFSLEYNDLLNFRETETIVTFFLKDEASSPTPQQLIEIEKLQLNDETTELKNFLVSTYNYAEASMIESQLGKSNLPAIKIISDDKNSVHFFAKNSKEVYRLSHQSRDEKSKNQVRTLYYQMIYSFQLLKEVQSELSRENEEKTEGEKESTELEQDKNTEDEEKNDEKNEENKSTSEDMTINESTAEEEFVVIASEESEKAEETKKNQEVSEKNTGSAENSEEKIAESYVLVMAYVQENLLSLIPEADKVKSGWKTDSFEFTGKNMVYVLYSSSGEKRKMLLSYSVNGTQVQTNFLAHYTQGEEKDWQKTDGTDPAIGQSKEVIEVSSSGSAVKQAEVKAGYRLFESGPYHFSMQIPMDWYYSGSGGHYGFSNKPVTPENELFGIDIVASSGNGSATEINGKKAFIETGEKFVLYLEKSDGRWYKLSGATSLESTIRTIAGTIED